MKKIFSYKIETYIYSAYLFIFTTYLIVFGATLLTIDYQFDELYHVFSTLKGYGVFDLKMFTNEDFLILMMHVHFGFMLLLYIIGLIPLLSCRCKKKVEKLNVNENLL